MNIVFMVQTQKTLWNTKTRQTEVTCGLSPYSTDSLAYLVDLTKK